MRPPSPLPLPLPIVVVSAAAEELQEQLLAREEELTRGEEAIIMREEKDKISEMAMVKSVPTLTPNEQKPRPFKRSTSTRWKYTQPTPSTPLASTKC
jgi:hypothetical protein